MRDKNTINYKHSKNPQCSPKRTCFAIWRPENGEGLEIVESNQHPGHYPHHLHEVLEIIWVHSGSAEITCRGKASLIRAGEACIISPNELHGGGAVNNSLIRFTLIHIPRHIFGHELERYTGEKPKAPITVISKKNAGIFLPMLINGLKAKNSVTEWQAVVNLAMSGLLRSASCKGSKIFGLLQAHQAVDRVKSILRCSCNELIGLDSLAKEVDLNERYLISLFKGVTGMSPHQFQIAMRVDLARRLIQSDTPLSVTAVDAGFADQSHLNRHFKRQYGVTPGEFRNYLSFVQ